MIAIFISLVSLAISIHNYITVKKHKGILRRSEK